jgi:beta-lactamase regulating signal transducer with metallopeptidase domain
MGMTGWIEATSQVAASALIASVWQGILLAGIISICIKLAPRTTAGIRFLIWMAVFLAVALLPVFSSLAGSHAQSAAIAMGSPAASAMELDSRWALGIAALWLVCSVFRGAGLIGNAFRLRSLWKRAVPIDAGTEIQAILGGASVRRAQLCISGEVDQPCVIGFFAPRVLIPGWLMEKATASELEQIVLHEISHLRRFDDWANLFQKIALVCFPLNPALVWVERRLCAERELACDESVIRTTQAPSDYATCLTNLAEERLTRRSAALSLGAWEKQSQLAGRIESILRGSAMLSPRKARVMMAMLMLGTVGGAVKLGSSGQLVSFAPSQQGRLSAGGQTEQALQRGVSGARYQDVVFHPQSIAGRSSIHKGVTADYESAPAQTARPRPVEKKPLGQASARVDGSEIPVQSLIIVTSWESPSGQQTTVTVIDGAFHTSTLSAAQLQSGWYVVQL